MLRQEEITTKRRNWLKEHGYTDSQINDILACDGKEEAVSAERRRDRLKACGYTDSQITDIFACDGMEDMV